MAQDETTEQQGRPHLIPKPVRTSSTVLEDQQQECSVATWRPYENSNQRP